MPTFSGKFQYLNPDGSALQAGPCQIAFQAEILTLTPGSGAPLALDFGDIDLFLPGEYELALTLCTGKKIQLNQFGKTFQNLCHDLLEAYGFLQDLRLRHHARSVLREGTVDNLVNTKEISKLDLLILKESLKVVSSFRKFLMKKFDLSEPFTLREL